MTVKTRIMTAMAGLFAMLNPGPGIAANDSMQDDMFFATAARGGMMEVELGRLAAQKAASQAVKDFGQRMVTDHGKANQQLQQIAAQKQLRLPGSLPPNMQQERDKIAALSGAEFDRMYMSHMVKDHEKDVQEFEKQVEKGKDPEFRAFAEKTLPVLRQHLELARSVAAQVGAGHENHGSKSGS